MDWPAGYEVTAIATRQPQWWYFDHPEVPPTQPSERSLRLAVTKRKVSGGSRFLDRFARQQTLSVSADPSPTGTVIMEFSSRP